MVRQSKRENGAMAPKSKRAKMENSNSLPSLPNAVLQHTFSFLSTKELPEVAQVLFKYSLKFPVLKLC